MPRNNDLDNSLIDKVELLETSVSKLLKYAEALKEENITLKHSNHQLLVERSELQNKNDKVRGQIEAMVERLKSMEKTS